MPRRRHDYDRIRELLGQGLGVRAIAGEIGCEPSLVSKVRLGKAGSLGSYTADGTVDLLKAREHHRRLLAKRRTRLEQLRAEWMLTRERLIATKRAVREHQARLDIIEDLLMGRGVKVEREKEEAIG